MKPDTFLTEKTFSFNGSNNHVYLVDAETHEKTEIHHQLQGLNIYIEGNDNEIEIMFPIGKFVNCNICITKSIGAHVVFENYIYLEGCFFSIHNGEKQNIIIEKYTSFTGGAVIWVHENSSLHIKQDCMFSSNIVIWTADGHAMYDIESKKVLNFPPKELVIGEHCWIGYNCSIYKNAGLAKNSIFAASSVLTQSIKEENVALAGNPAKIIKRGVSWSRMSTKEFSEKLRAKG